MAIETIEELTVDTSLLEGRTWDGCCWIHPDGTVIAVNYARHYKYAEQLLGKYSSSYDLARDPDHPGMMHVSDYTWATGRPTAAQKDALAHLAAKYPKKVGHSMSVQEWKVENYNDGSEKWAV